MTETMDSVLQCVSASGDRISMRKDGKLLYTMTDTVGGGEGRA